MKTHWGDSGVWDITVCKGQVGTFGVCVQVGVSVAFFERLLLTHFCCTKGLMTVNLAASAQALGQRFYTLWSIDLYAGRPKNPSFLHVVKKGFRYGSKTLDLGGQRIAGAGF